MILTVAVAVCSASSGRLVCMRLVRRYRGGPWLHLYLARRVSVAVAVRSVAVTMSVPVSCVSVPVAVAGVSCISRDVRAVGQGLHVDRSIAESDSRGRKVRTGHPRYRY